MFKEEKENIPIAMHARELDADSKQPQSSATHHIIVFDQVVTNVRNGYHPHSGTFMAPRSGLYVFTWTFQQWGTSYHVTELLS